MTYITDRLEIWRAGNGYIIQPADRIPGIAEGNALEKIFVFETFEGMVEYLKKAMPTLDPAQKMDPNLAKRLIREQAEFMADEKLPSDPE